MMCSIDLFFVYLSRVARGESKMADCSPDSSTQQRPPKKRRKHDPMREDATGKKFPSEPDDIQNHAINSTQDLDRKFQMRADENAGKSKLKSRFKAKLKHLGLTTYDPILEVEEIESDFREWSSQHLVLQLKSLSELVADRSQLSREVFHIINKKEFKKLLPRRLKKYNVRDVKTWCINEIENTPENSLLCMLKGEDNGEFQATVSQQDVAEKLNPPSPKESNESEKVAENIENNPATIDNSTDVDTDTKMAHGAMEMRSDPELFQEIIKSPDQNDIDELLKEEISCEAQALSPMNADSRTTEKVTNNKEKRLAMLEMELRARALKSLIKAQEMKNKNSN